MCWCIPIGKTVQDAHTTPNHVLSRCVFIPNKFPTLLAEREIIANAFLFYMSVRDFCSAELCKRHAAHPERATKIVISFKVTKFLMDSLMSVVYVVGLITPLVR